MSLLDERYKQRLGLVGKGLAVGIDEVDHVRLHLADMNGGTEHQQVIAGQIEIIEAAASDTLARITRGLWLTISDSRRWAI